METNNNLSYVPLSEAIKREPVNPSARLNSPSITPMEVAKFFKRDDEDYSRWNSNND